MDGSAALLAEVAEILEVEGVRILVDEEIPALRARVAGLLARAPELQLVGLALMDDVLTEVEAALR